ncbi:uncharacterized protein L201_005106 [Kwoniella dendrophila CBS 6074]|uniref:Distal membrane-arm assembly complex protein 1-like domain-containing protein n=1 Tax=Kwoniella dendrophila CBS 6074 TaxID=1295534 RepID=A0AAX4JZ81_9TREE
MSSAAISQADPRREPGYAKNEDCLSCRLVGSGAFIGLGSYAIMQARRQGAFEVVRPAKGPMVAPKAVGILGTVFIGMGIYRLFMPGARA